MADEKDLYKGSEDSAAAKKKVEEMIGAVGATAEMALIFYHVVQKHGATPEEAVKLTQAFIAAFLYGNDKRN